VDQELEDATAALEAVRDAIAELPIACHVMDSATNGWNRLVLKCGEALVSLPEGVALRAWPITRPAQSAVRISAWPVDLGEVPQAEITSFIAFEVHSSVEQVPDLRFVMNLPLVGAPAGRRACVGPFCRSKALPQKQSRACCRQT